GSQMALGELMFMCVFLTPFVVIGAGMIFVCMASLFGSVRVQIDGTHCRIRTGIGPLSLRQSFDASAVKAIRVGQTSWQSNGRSQAQIHIEADRTVKFGSPLSSQRLSWMAATLRTLLVNRG